MKSSFIRTSVVTGVTAVAALATAACSPQLENPSDEKVETATGFSAAPSATDSAASATQAVAVEPGAPNFIDCVAPPAQTPTTVSLDCTNNSDTLTDVTWENWGTEEATGSGTREITDPASGETGTEEDVEIVLSVPFEGPQGLVFTEITVDGQVINP